MKTLLLVVISVGMSLIADIFLKRSVGVSHLGFFSAGFLLYGLSAIPIALVFTRTEFGLVFILWEALAVGTGLVVATLLFHEPLTASKISAMMLVLGALVLSTR